MIAENLCPDRVSVSHFGCISRRQQDVQVRCSSFGPGAGGGLPRTAEPWNGHAEGHLDPSEVGQEHPEDHSVHEDGVRRQVSFSGFGENYGFPDCENCTLLDFRYARAERDLKQARPYGVGAQQFYEKAEVAAKEEEPKKLYIAVTSDRGMLFNSLFFRSKSLKFGCNSNLSTKKLGFVC